MLGTKTMRRRQAKIGELLMETELLYAKVDQLEAGGPLARLAEVDAMRGARASISTRRAYGVQRVCRVWHRAGAPVCMRGGRRHGLLHCVVAAGRSAHCPGRRPGGPAFAGCSKPRRFMARATVKAWAKLRVAGMRTSKERVRRLMREHDLQAPPRAGHAHGPTAHDGTCDHHRGRPT